MKCLDVNEELTPLGRILAKLPIEPQIGRMMVLGNILFLGDSLSIIAAMCSNMTDVFVFGMLLLNNIYSYFILIFLFIDHRMTPAQRILSGNRCSDHLTMLNAFHRWSSLFHRNINTTDYCEHKMLSQPSLITIADIAVLYIFHYSY